jgi:hypothetical protein
MEIVMRVPILSLNNPERRLWLTDDPPHGTSGYLVLIDAVGQIYYPADTLGATILKPGICRLDVYYAAKAAGYQVEWVV